MREQGGEGACASAGPGSARAPKGSGEGVAALAAAREVPQAEAKGPRGTPGGVRVGVRVWAWSALGRTCDSTMGSGWGRPSLTLAGLYCVYTLA